MNIEFYSISDEYQPQIFQSSARRDWMDASTSKHPYKCIPIVRANSHGWELRLEQDITVVWNGEESPDGLQIIDGEYHETNHQPLAASLVGHGVITFYCWYLVKTPKPYNLYVSGAPNHFVKGAAPVTGVVETWWSPYTFTMNWKIRYKNRPVTFKKGTPFVYFFPIDSLALEEFTPVIKNAKEHEHYAEYKEWSDDRAANPSKQHHYYKKGTAPNGCPIAHEDLHKLKLSLQEPGGQVHERGTEPSGG